MPTFTTANLKKFKNKNYIKQFSKKSFKRIKRKDFHTIQKILEAEYDEISFLFYGGANDNYVFF